MKSPFLVRTAEITEGSEPSARSDPPFDPSFNRAEVQDQRPEPNIWGNVLEKTVVLLSERVGLLSEMDVEP